MGNFCRRISVWIAVLASMLAGTSGLAEEGKEPILGVPAQKLTIKDSAGNDRPFELLGGDLGIQKSGGVEARLFVLQASSPEPFRTQGAHTHVFTVILSETDGGNKVEGAKVSILTGPGEDAKVVLQEFKGRFYQGKARLADAGKYRLRVRFKGGEKSGTVEFPFEVFPPSGASPGAPGN